MTPSGRVGYFVQSTRKSIAAVQRYHRSCRDDRVPSVVIRMSRGTVNVNVDMDPAGYPCSLDATAYVKLKAVLGTPMDYEVLSGQSLYSSTSFYASRLKAEHPDALGEEIAAILQDGLPFACRWLEEGAPAPPRRDPDWAELAEFYAARVRDEQTTKAIRAGYFVYHGVRDSDYYGYQVHCTMAGRPVIRCQIQRGRGTLWFEQNHRIKYRLPEDVAARIRSIVLDSAGPEAIEAMHCPIEMDGGMILGIPASVAERVASELSRLAFRVVEVGE